MNRYKEIMDRIVVTDEMHDRILGNIEQQTGAATRRRAGSVRTWLPVLAAAAILLVVCGVTLGVDRGNRTAADSTPEMALATAEPDEVASIYDAVDYDSAAALSEAVGFSVTDIAALPFSPVETRYTAIMGDLAEITYEDADGNEICYRRSPGTEDNSGDYTSYAREETAGIGGQTVTLKGDDDLVYLAIWNDGQYASSIYVTNGCSRETMQDMIEELQADSAEH